MAASTVWAKRVAAAGAGALWLAACAVAPEPASEPVATTAQPVEPPAVVVPPPHPARKPTPPAAQVAAVTLPGPTPGPTPEPDAEPPSEPVDPQQVNGLDEGNAESWLGQPGQRTEAPPATIWHYTTRDCEIDVYFYLDLQNRVMRALQYEVRSNDFVERRPERCFQQLVGEHRQREGSSVSAYSPR